MTSAFVIPLCIIAACILIPWIGYYVSSRLEMKRLSDHGRLMSWHEALDKVKHGEGYILIDKNNFYNKIWWTSAKIDESDKSPAILMEKETKLTDYKGKSSALRKLVPSDRIVEITGVVRT